MKILIASDAYKGSLTTFEAAGQIQKGALRVYPEAEFVCIPIADGGEGTVDTILKNLAGDLHWAKVEDPLGNRIDAKFGILESGGAILEMAAASGLPLVPAERRNVFSASTYGTGQLIRAALDCGCRKMYVGIGGSATNDGGAGMAQALGVSFLDQAGKELERGAEALKNLCTIDLANLGPRIKNTEIIVMCDVNNPLCGPAGASAVYGPQKGAAPEDIEKLDQCLTCLANVVQKEMKIDFRDFPGAGAAGGLGMGMLAFLGATLKPGIEVILEMSKFEEKLRWADIVITGEGCIDRQSVSGKVVDGVARAANALGVPVAAVAGSLSEEAKYVYGSGIAAIEAAVCRPMSLQEAVENAPGLLADAVERLLRAVRLGSSL